MVNGFKIISIYSLSCLTLMLAPSYSARLLDLADDTMVVVYSHLSPADHRMLAATCKHLHRVAQKESVLHDLQTKTTRLHNELKGLNATVQALAKRHRTAQETLYETRRAAAGRVFMDSFTYTIISLDPEPQQEKAQRHEIEMLSLALKHTERQIACLRKALYPPEPPQHKVRAFPFASSALKWLASITVAKGNMNHKDAKVSPPSQP